MCGIFGMILPSHQQADREVVKKATDTLWHRGPDDGGYFFNRNIAFGNRRLAILDLSDHGHQPMHYKDLTITYNGEIYNYKEIRTQLQSLGYNFKTGTDTEVVLAAYHAWGPEAIHRFNGMWALAIYDPNRQLVFCSRDRFGIKPFYYFEQNNSLSFASEIKAFRTLVGWDNTPNQKMSYDFLVRGLQNHSEHTLYDKVRQLPPGHHLVYDLTTERYDIKRYYNLAEKAINLPNNYTQAADQFLDLLDDSIRLRLRSDVKLGAAVSGGLDSSTIVALYRRLQPRATFETVSYTSPYPEFDERPYIAALQHNYFFKNYRVESQFEETISLIEEVIRSHDEPLQSASLIAQYQVFQTAKNHKLKVMLDGQGADEILAGYGTFYPPFFKELSRTNPLLLLPEIFGLLSRHHIKWNRFTSFISPKTDLGKYFHLESRTYETAFHDLKSYSIYMVERGILPALLQFEDRNSMAHSVESRVPFLDHRLVEFCMSLPAKNKIRNGVRKHILRQAMQNKLPQKILCRYDKMGFTTPQHYWMEQHSSYFYNQIVSLVEHHPTYFNTALKDFVRLVLTKKKATHYNFIWRLMSFGKWLSNNG